MSTPYWTPLSSGHGPHRAHESSRSDKSPPFSVITPSTPVHPSSRRTSHSAGRPVHMLHHRTQSLELDMSQWPIAPPPSTSLSSSKPALAYASSNPEVSPPSAPDSPLADPDLVPPSMRRRGRAIPLPPISPIGTAHAPPLHSTSKLSSTNSATLSRVRRCMEAVSLVGHELAPFAPFTFPLFSASLQGSLHSIQTSLSSRSPRPFDFTSLDRYIARLCAIFEDLCVRPARTPKMQHELDTLAAKLQRVARQMMAEYPVDSTQSYPRQMRRGSAAHF